MITTLLTFLGSTIGRYAIIGAGFAAFVGAYTWQQRSIGAKKERAKIVEKSNKAAKKRNAKARKIRSSNTVSGASQRLFKRYGPGAD